MQLSAVTGNSSYKTYAIAAWAWQKANALLDGWVVPKWNTPSLYWNDDVNNWIGTGYYGAASWDCSFWGLVALQMGDTAWASAMAGVIAANMASIALPMTGTYLTENYTHDYVNLGMGAALEFLATIGGYSSDVATLKTQLQDNQLSDGSWGFQCTYPPGDAQTTAFCVMGLYAAGEYATARKGADWLVATQLAGPRGGWLELDGNEYSEIDSESLQALASSIPQLTVVSAYDSPSPSGTTTYWAGTTITSNVTSPVYPAGTRYVWRYVCTGWTGTGDAPASGSGTTMTFTISQDSSITWNWKTQYYPAVTISPSSAMIDLGQGQVFTSAVSNGTSPYTYQWYLSGVAQGTSSTSSTWTLTPSSAGSYSVYVVVTDGAGARATSNTATVTVYGALSVSVSPASAIMDVNQSKLFTSTVSGGTSSYSYQWYLNAFPVSGATSVAWSFPPSSAGSYTVYVEVTDGVGAKATSNTATAIRALHCVAVTNVLPSKTFVGQGLSDRINVTVTNQGSYTETFKATVYANATFVASQNVTASIGNSATTTFVWNTAGFARGMYTIKVQVALAPGETNTANNTYTGGQVLVTKIGDVNGDGVVNSADAILVLLHFGTVPPQPPECDVNGDGVVNSADAILVLLHFG
jgi:hypothetical protein